MNKLKKEILSLIIVLAIFSFTVIGSQAAGFDTNIDGWMSADDGVWEIKEDGFYCTNNNGNNLAKSNLVIDGTKSFIYEVTASFTGHGFGIAFGVKDNENFTAIEINTERKIYCPRRVDNNWSLWASDFKDLPASIDGTDGYTIKFMFDATEKTAIVFLDGVIVETLVNVDPNLLKGNVGLQTEVSDAVVTKATYTEVDSIDLFETNIEGWAGAGNGTWNKKSIGLITTNNGGNNLAKSNLVIDGTKSFEYEVTGAFTGHGFGVAFGVENDENFTAIEINTEGKLYCPRRVNNEWSLWASDFKELPAGVNSADGYTLKVVFNEEDKSIEIYVDGILADTLADVNVDLIKGNVGLMTEHSDVVVTKALFIETGIEPNTETDDFNVSFAFLILMVAVSAVFVVLINKSIIVK